MVGIDISRTSNPSGSLGVAQSMTNLGGFLASLVVLAGMGAVMTALGGFTPEAFRVAWLLQYPVWAIAAVGGWSTGGRPALDARARRGPAAAAGRAGRGAAPTTRQNGVPQRDLPAAGTRAVELAEAAGRLQLAAPGRRHRAGTRRTPTTWCPMWITPARR